MFTECDNIDEDLNVICFLSEKFLNDTTVLNSDKLSLFIKEVSTLPLSKTTKKFIYDASYASSFSYENFKEFASSNKIENWHCECLHKLLQLNQ